MDLTRFRSLTSILLALSLLTSGVLRAQNAPPAPGAKAPPANAAEKPPSKNSGKEEMVGPTSLRDAPLSLVLDMLERLTGRSVIRPQALPSPTFTLTTHENLSKKEFIVALESLLSINGIGVAPLGDKFLKVVPITNIPREAPELVVGSLLNQPPSGKVVSKLFRLKYLDSKSFQTQIQPFLSPGFGTVVPFQNSNAVIVTDTISNLQRLEYVVKEVDKPSKLNIETRFYRLNYAKASDVANELHTLIETARSGLGNNGNTNAGLPPPPQNESPRERRQRFIQEMARAAENSSAVPISIISGNNTFINSDERTNQLIVITDPSNLPFFDNIIKKLDIPAELPTKIEVKTLNHADATEVASILSQFVSGRSTSGSTTSSNKSSSFFGNSFNSTSPSSSRRNNNNNNTNNQSERRQNAVNAVRNTLDQEGGQFSKEMTIVADERSNSLIISGTKEDLRLINEIVDKLDVLLAEVRIQVVIAEVTLSKGQASGLDQIEATLGLTRNSDGSNTVRTVTLPSGGLGLTNSNNGMALGLNSGTATITNGIITNLSVDAVLGVAKTDSNVHILSAPSIVTTHNKEASIIVGESIPIQTSQQTGINANGVNYSTIQYQDVAIELKVKPLIGPNDVIQMDIDQSVNNVENSSTITINNQPQPIISRREATSFVSVKNKQMVVLGGLQSQETDKTKGKMFLLGDIPVLGHLFTHEVKTTKRTDLIMFIKPTIIRTADEANDDATKEMNSLQDSQAVKDFSTYGNNPPPAKKDKKSKKAPAESHFHKN